MPKIHFKIDLKQDARNWARTVKMKRHPFGRNKKEMLEKIPAGLRRKMKPVSRDQAIKMAYGYLKSNSVDFLDELEANKGLLEYYFNNKGNSLFKEIAKLTGKSIYTKNFYATFTLMTSCPYDPASNWFMVAAPRPMSRQITNIFHEILHLQFIHHYRKYCLKKGLTEKQFQDLKEAITFLLNEPVFKKYGLAPDRGYPNHQELRKELKKIWQKQRKFKIFLDKSIELMLNEKK